MRHLPGRGDGTLRSAVRAEERAATEELAGGVRQQPDVLPVGRRHHDAVRLQERRAAHAVHRLEQLDRPVARGRAAAVDRTHRVLRDGMSPTTSLPPDAPRMSWRSSSILTNSVRRPLMYDWIAGASSSISSETGRIVAIFLIGSSAVRPSVDSGFVRALSHTRGAGRRGAFHDVPDAVRGRLPGQDQVGDREPLEQRLHDTGDDLRDRRGERAAAAAGALEERALHVHGHGTGRRPLGETATVL